MPSPILARADALMQRRRPGVTDNEDVPVLTDTVDSDEDDIPVLFEVAALPPVKSITPDEPPPCPSPVPEAVTDEAAGLAPPIAAVAEPAAPVQFPATAIEPVPLPAQALEADPAFDRALLDIVAHELARRVNDRLAAELPAIIEATVRDFLAEREMLELIRPRD